MELTEDLQIKIFALHFYVSLRSQQDTKDNKDTKQLDNRIWHLALYRGTLPMTLYHTFTPALISPISPISSYTKSAINENEPSHSPI